MQDSSIAAATLPWLDLGSGSTLQIDGSHDLSKAVRFDISDRLKILYDTSGSYSILHLPQFESDFTRLDDPIIDQVSSKVKAYWLLFNIENHSGSERWYLGLHHRDIEFFIRDNSALIHQGITGTHRKIISGINWLTPMPYIPLNLKKGVQYQIILRVTPKLITTVGHRAFDDLDRTIVNSTYLHQYRSDLQWQLYVAIGILGTIFIYHFVLFLYNREIIFLHLSLFALFLLFAKILYNGILYTSLQLDTYGLLNDILVLLLYASGAIAFRFTLSYLQISRYSVQGQAIRFLEFAWIFSFLSVTILVLFSETTFLSQQSSIANILTAQTIIQQPFLLSIGLICWTKGNKNAMYYLAGLSIWLAIHFLNILQAHNVVHVSTDFPRDIVGASGIILFAFGLARRFKNLQLERAAAEKQRLLTDQLRHLDQQEANRLKELNRFKSQLYTNITHEFRTPLTVIRGMADQLDDASEEKTLIQRNADSLLDLVNQMLDLSKLDAGKLRLNLIQVNMVGQIKYLAETYHRITTAQEKVFRLELLEDSLWLDMDPNFFERILNNLVHNAIKFSPKGSTIKVRLQKIDGRAIIEVADQGRGIAAGEQSKIFDRFYQIDASTTRQGQGAGIGLAMAKELTHLLEGEISLRSQLGQGSTFIVRLPITNQLPMQAPNAVITSTEPTLSLPKANEKLADDKATILIIEDHDDVRHYLLSLLTFTFSTLSSSDGRSGLSLAIEHVPDLIISDVMMPEMDGFQLCDKLKGDQRTSHIPVILLTAKSTQEDRLEGLQEGADAYLVKPFDKRELFIRIEKLLESRENLRKHYQQFDMLPQEQVQENKFLEKVRAQLEVNLNNAHYQIDDLATALHIGRVQLFRKLKALTGKSYTQLLKEMRMNRAKSLLKKTDKTVSEIAFEVGFKDGSYFGKVFGKEVGMSASQFRSVK